MKAMHERGNPCVLAVRGRKLVDQASQRLEREGVPHGVLMAGHWRQRKNEIVQVCSIDTLVSRAQYPDAKLLVLDEAHLFTSEKSVEFIQYYVERGVLVLAVTASPFTDQPLTHLADTVVEPITMKRLIELGYLVPPRYFAPAAPDMKGVRVNRGEFNEEQTMQAMAPITGDIVGHWKKFAAGRPTLAFAINVAHSMHIAELFNQAGIAALHVDASSSDSDRLEAIHKLESGQVQVISNCGILCTGVDIPKVSCILMARPTASLNLYLQIAGRGTRISDDKKDFILLDHAGNVTRHGFITDERAISLEGKNKTKRGPNLNVKICKQCFLAYDGSACPDCGPIENEIKKRDFQTTDGELKEIKSFTLPGDEEKDPIQIYLDGIKKTCKARGYKTGWVWHQMKEKYGEETADKYLKKKELPEWVKKKIAAARAQNIRN